MPFTLASSDDIRRYTQSVDADFKEEKLEDVAAVEEKDEVFKIRCIAKTRYHNIYFHV